MRRAIDWGACAADFTLETDGAVTAAVYPDAWRQQQKALGVQATRHGVHGRTSVGITLRFSGMSVWSDARDQWNLERVSDSGEMPCGGVAPAAFDAHIEAFRAPPPGDQMQTAPP